MIARLSPGNGEIKCGLFWTLKHPGHHCVFVWSSSRAVGNISAVVSESFCGITGSEGYRG